MLGPHTVSLLGINIPEHFLEYKREKSFVSSPRTIILVKTVFLAISRDTFNKV